MSEQPAIDFLNNFPWIEGADWSFPTVEMSFEFINRIFYFESVDDIQ